MSILRGCCQRALGPLLGALLLAPLAGCGSGSEAPVLTPQQVEQGRAQRLSLWYEQPAVDWMTEALPIGNAYLGAMFFGGIDRERIQFNEESLWNGGPGEWAEYRGGNRAGASEHLPEVRRLLDAGDFDAAHKLTRRELTGVIKAEHADSVWEGFGAYQAFGDLFVEIQRRGEVQDYRRELLLDRGLGRVSYRAGGVAYTREYFASYPRRAIAVRFSSDAPHGLEYSLRLVLPHAGARFHFDEGVLTVSGELPNNGMAYESRLLLDTDGAVSWEEGQLKVAGARSLSLYLSAATDYRNDYPDYKGRDHVALNARVIENIRGIDYSTLRAEHIADFGALFGRVDLDLDRRGLAYLPTDRRLALYRRGLQDNDLEALYFQYGRYLLMSASRPGSLPANLQGKWNDSTVPKWASDYHANINIQMIYWLAEVGNLAQVHEPLIDYIDSLRRPGRVTAREYFDARGWNVHVANNIFGYTAPGWDLPWGFFPSGAAWYGRHVWEHYQFNRDEAYLRQRAYPILRETAEFWLDHLYADGEGHLSSSPSYSPEHGTVSAGAYMDVQIVWDLFNNTLQAARILGIDDSFTEDLRRAHRKLLPPRIGRWGQLQEWKEDVDDPDSRHRHVSHLYALYPGEQISPGATPALAQAAAVSLDARGEEGTGWSIGWKINFRARLQQPERAYRMVRRALRQADKPGFVDKYIGLNMLTGGGVYPNLLSTHPPFQLDGNMGTAAGMAEMLVQSHEGFVRLLPALPEAWEEGSVRGLKLRGNAEISMRWSRGELLGAQVVAAKAGEFEFEYRGRRLRLQLQPGVPQNIEFQGETAND